LFDIFQITTPKELVALMSAICQGDEPSFEDSKRTHSFLQKVPIPSYLIALVVGDLESRYVIYIILLKETKIMFLAQLDLVLMSGLRKRLWRPLLLNLQRLVSGF
jgi:aminopeptidase N